MSVLADQPRRIADHGDNGRAQAPVWADPGSDEQKSRTIFAPLHCRNNVRMIQTETISLAALFSTLLGLVAVLNPLSPAAIDSRQLLND